MAYKTVNKSLLSISDNMVNVYKMCSFRLVSFVTAYPTHRYYNSNSVSNQYIKLCVLSV